MFNLSRKRLSITRVKTWIADDSGAAALIIAAVVAVIAFTALSIFLNKFIGGRELQRVQSASTSQGSLVKTVFASFLSSGSGGTYTLPCPDTSATPTGVAGTCTGTSGIVSGVLPWTALGLSKADVVDAYGNYLTYVVGLKGKNLCESVANNMTGAAEITGSLPAATDLTLDTRGETRDVAFAIIGHGPNRLGGRNSRNNNIPSTAPLNHELSNSQATLASGSAATVYNDAFSKSSSTYFDDEVLAPTDAEASQVCKSLTPGGALNAALTTNFDSAAERSGTMDAAKFSNVTNVSVAQATSGGQGNYVARFSATGAMFASNPGNGTTTRGYNFDPRVQKVYVTAEWTPSLASDGMSILTRADASGVRANDTLTQGITFRFANGQVVIEEGGVATPVTPASTFTQTASATYVIEAYDDGTNLWARITRKNSTTVNAFVATTNANDFAVTQQVAFISTGASNDLDNLTIGIPMLALEFNGNSSIGYAAAAGADVSISGATFSAEAWIKPKALPTGTAVGTIMSRWDSTSTADTNNTFRMFLGRDGVLSASLQGVGDLTSGVDDNVIGDHTDDSDISTGIKPAIGEWTHIAAVFSGGSPGKLKFYQNGSLVKTVSLAIASVSSSASNPFTVGADSNHTNGFTGDVSDVRIWSTERTASEIRANYASRLALTGTVSGLVINWKLDSETATPSGSTSPINTPATGSGDAASPVNASYVAVLAQYFRPFSTSVCPGREAGAYMCDFRGASGAVSANIPSNLLNVYAKVWGGGGGGYHVSTNIGAGGSGGFSQGLIETLGGERIAGKVLNIDLGPAGTGNTTASADRGAGGGGATGVSVVISSATTYGLIAGGGGGASYSAAHTFDLSDFGVVDDPLDPLDLYTLLGPVLRSSLLTYYTGSGGLGVSSYGQGGAGGGGGGYSADMSADTVRAVDSVNTCGGRGGNNTPTDANPPPSTTTNACSNGGTPPTSTINGGGGTAATLGPLGGVSAAGNGGNGYLSSVSTLVGGGGGGGGASGGEGGGYAGTATISQPTDVAYAAVAGLLTTLGNSTVSVSSGFGGGGGSGAADAAVTRKSGAAGTSTNTGGYLDFYYRPYTYTNQAYVGRGGEIVSGVAGVNGNVILIW